LIWHHLNNITANPRRKIMNTLVNTFHANEARELSTDELSAVSGGHGPQCPSNSGPSWGSLATAASVATTVAGGVVTGGAGLIAQMATIGTVEVVKQSRD
jgi:hypothetical protein